MNNICLFSSYYTKPSIPNYVKFYLEELKKRFKIVILITNYRIINENDINFLSEIGVELKLVDNKGYDFGMWYKYLQSNDISIYDELALVNDSCILYRNLDGFFKWCDSSNSDYCGMLNSNEIDKHIQSYFLIIKKNAIPYVISYFKKMGYFDNINDVINNYEIGMCQFLMNNKIKTDTYFKCENYSDYNINTMLLHIKDLISDGLPIIKKKIIFNTFSKNEIVHLINQGFDFRFDYKSLLENIMYSTNDNININYLYDY